jgi:surfactin synthase thioesterase subunit
MRCTTKGPTPVTIADHAITPWIRRYRPTDRGRTRLVCFPHAGGAATYFNPVAARFSPDVDVVALQYPGRQDRRREPCVADLATLAELITQELLALSDLPTVFFGHSMGAMLAFETAWRLEARGVGEPRALLLSGRRAPSTVREEQVHQRDDDGLIAEMRLLNGTDASLMEDEEILRMAVHSLRGDLAAVETYVDAGHRVSCPVTVFTGDSDPKTTVEEAERWREHAQGPFRMRVFAGGHFFLNRHLGPINDEIAAELGRWQHAAQDDDLVVDRRDPAAAVP